MYLNLWYSYYKKDNFEKIFSKNKLFFTYVLLGVFKFETRFFRAFITHPNHLSNLKSVGKRERNRFALGPLDCLDFLWPQLWSSLILLGEAVLCVCKIVSDYSSCYVLLTRECVAVGLMTKYVPYVHGDSACSHLSLRCRVIIFEDVFFCR